VLNLIEDLNKDPRITSILVQLPLPAHIDERRVIEAINPYKDVDGFSIHNIGRLWANDSCIIPCTPDGILTLLDHYGIDVKGKHCVIVGRSNIVGKPLAAMLLQKDATVTICHTKTEKLSEITKTADILISAAGVPKLITADMVKEGVVAIDVGINRDENNRFCGDFDYENVEPLCSYITPVPGGIGPMTVAKLMERILITKKLQG
jgi:methylenetetrahydrofolate dehydrogenase (NADP+)/methenyltetrahydrofolate cyclohydrolase